MNKCASCLASYASLGPLQRLVRMSCISIAFLGATSCSNAYRDIEERFPAPNRANSFEFVAENIALIARPGRPAGSAAHFHARFAKGYVILDPAGIDALFFSAVQISADEIYGCEVIDFGRFGIDVKLPLRNAPAAFMAPDKGRLLNWCWRNNLPSLSKREYGAWEKGMLSAPETLSAAEPTSWEEYREMAIAK